MCIVNSGSMVLDDEYMLIFQLFIDMYLHIHVARNRQWSVRFSTFLYTAESDFVNICYCCFFLLLVDVLLYFYARKQMHLIFFILQFRAHFVSVYRSIIMHAVMLSCSHVCRESYCKQSWLFISNRLTSHSECRQFGNCHNFWFTPSPVWNHNRLFAARRGCRWTVVSRFHHVHQGKASSVHLVHLLMSVRARVVTCLLSVPPTICCCGRRITDSQVFLDTRLRSRRWSAVRSLHAISFIPRHVLSGSRAPVKVKNFPDPFALAGNCSARANQWTWNSAAVLLRHFSETCVWWKGVRSSFTFVNTPGNKNELFILSCANSPSKSGFGNNFNT